MHVSEIFRYPVKSMRGERLASAQLLAEGILGDRAWALRDEARDGLTGAKRFPALMSMSARFQHEPDGLNRSPPVTITAGAGAGPDQTAFSSADADVNARLSALLEHPVTLWPLLPAAREEHYRREALPAGSKPEDAMREVFARTADEPLPDVSKFPPVLFTHHSPPGTYFDAYPLLILSRSALAALAARARAAGSTSVFDLRRFRPNLLVETREEGFVEDAWCGRLLEIGSVVVKVEMTCPRCIMTTHGFDDLPRDPKVMRALVQHHGGDLGVYASVVQPGEIEAGATVRVID